MDKKSKDKVEEAKSLLEKEEERITKECVNELNEVLEKHGRKIAITPQITIGGKEPQIVILKK